MRRNNELVEKWEPGIQSMLVGCKIVGASYTTEEEMDDMGWDVAGLVIELDNRTFLTVWSVKMMKVTDQARCAQQSRV